MFEKVGCGFQASWKQASAGQRLGAIGLRTALSVVAFAAIFGCGQNVEVTPEEAYQQFKDALQDGDYGSLDAKVTETARERLGIWSEWALAGDKESLDRLPNFDRFMVLLARMANQELPPEAWLALERKRRAENSAYSFDILTSEAVALLLDDLKLGIVEYAGEHGGAPLYLNGVKVPVQARFLNEDGEWKVHLVPTLADLFDWRFVRYKGDEYRNRDRVVEMMSMLYGERFGRFLFDSPLTWKEADA